MKNSTLPHGNALVSRGPRSFERKPSFAYPDSTQHTVPSTLSHIKPARVCAVDDEEAVRTCLAEFLRKSKDFEFCGTFATATEALAQIPALKPDIVLMDIHMPGISGIECMRRLKNDRPGIKVIILSGIIDPAIARSALTSGADGYLLKPFEFNALVSAIRFALTGGTPLSRGISSTVIESSAGKIGADAALRLLTERERQLTVYLEQGLQYKEIADRLGISPATVTQHLHHIYEKLRVHNKIEALNKIFPRG